MGAPFPGKEDKWIRGHVLGSRLGDGTLPSPCSPVSNRDVLGFLVWLHVVQLPSPALGASFYLCVKGEHWTTLQTAFLSLCLRDSLKLQLPSGDCRTGGSLFFIIIISRLITEESRIQENLLSFPRNLKEVTTSRNQSWFSNRCFCISEHGSLFSGDIPKKELHIEL